jgi:Diaminopimelate epimerase
MDIPRYMSGTGDDFLVSGYENSLTDIEIISFVADSLFDIDGVIYVALIDSSTVKMHYYHHDGSTAELCVYGIRCVA